MGSPNKSGVSFNGLWISLDGSEGVGKSVLAKHLSEIIKDAVVAPEFSDSPTGDFLKNSVVLNPHFNSPSLIGQSLLFLADFFYIYDVVVRPALEKGKIVISDRGYASKYVYQYLVLSSEYDDHATRNLLLSLFELISPPDLTLYISTTNDIQYHRILDRDGHCDADRVAFIKQANTEFLEFMTVQKMISIQLNQTEEMSLGEFLSQGQTKVGDFINSRKPSDM